MAKHTIRGNGMKAIELVLVDIDGTLLNDQGMVTPKQLKLSKNLKTNRFYLELRQEEHHLQSNISLKSGKLNLMWM